MKDGQITCPDVDFANFLTIDGHPKFNWNMGGRLYSHGESNYQQMESADRLRMTINGEEVCEIDIRASYLTIFHALYDEPFDADE